jgi:hypothetical protein
MKHTSLPGLSDEAARQEVYGKLAQELPDPLGDGLSYISSNDPTCRTSQREERRLRWQGSRLPFVMRDETNV